MKRVILIASGTVSGLGAVLAITPPQLSSTSSEIALPTTGIQTSVATTTPTTTATPTTTKKSTTTSTKKATSSSPTPTPTSTPTQTNAQSGEVSGTFTGDAVNVSYGIVQVKITVANGKITDAQAIQAPSGRNDRWTQMSVPVLRQETIAVNGNNITGVSGASYTSYGWYTSLTSALTKAGMI